MNCKGKDFEHHERTEVLGDHTLTWKCPDCGDSGSLEAVNAKLVALVPMLYRLMEQMLDRDAVFLLPSDATPGPFGQFYGRPLFRVQGLDQPLIALGPNVFGLSGKPLVVQAAQGPGGTEPRVLNVTEALDAALLPYLDWPVWLREEGLTCERTDCAHTDCQSATWGPVTVSETGHTTLRAILAGLKVHAEATS